MTAVNILHEKPIKTLLCENQYYALCKLSVGTIKNTLMAKTWPDGGGMISRVKQEQRDRLSEDFSQFFFGMAFLK